jgi:GNAT superfamily N-acetyltransferase
MRHKGPFDKDEYYLLTGPAKLDVCVDDIFGKSLKVMIDDFREHDPDMIKIDSLDDGVKSIFCSRLIYKEVMAGLLLFDGDKPVGGYLGCDLSLDEEYRGKGLGKEIIIETFLREEKSPVWDLDTAAYSRAGLAAHQAAYWHVKKHPKETEYRKSRIYSGEDAGTYSLFARG